MVRVLVVDDSEDDAELVRLALRRGGIASALSRVDDRVALRRALTTELWDIVIADYSLPGFGALAVLEQIRSHGAELPCIVVSGVAGEDRAVETMRAGARDFVNKDRLQRLAPIVLRELAESAERRDRRAQADAERARDLRLREASAALVSLVRSDAFRSGDLLAIQRNVTVLLCRTIDVDSASIWMLDERREVLQCVEAYNRRTETHSRGNAFDVRQSPDYLRALDHGRFVEAHDHRVSEPELLGSDRVSSQLDVAVRLRGETVGALCLDHVGPRRVWRSDDQVFAGSIADLLSLVMEANERRRTETALRESEERYRELWHFAIDGIFTLDSTGTITSVNRAGQLMLGSTEDEVVGRSLTEFIAGSDLRRTQDRYRRLVDHDERGGPYPFTVKPLNGPELHVEATVQRIDRGTAFFEGLAVVRDVTERHRLESQLQQAQRMEAVGRLAGGVAHDFNNLLTAIVGYARMASVRPDVPPAAVIDLQEITSAAQRAAALTRQLLAFSRRQVLQPKIIEINAMLRHMHSLLTRLVGSMCTCDIDLEPQLANVLADPTQFEQVVLNLVVNARDAMSEGGTVTVRTRMATAADPGVLISADAAAGPFVVLEVSDTGQGMDEETRLRVFEPFFTTKPTGTGLGLSTVYGIVQQSGGGIGVRSAPGSGTTFSVFLPVAVGNSDEMHRVGPVLGGSATS